MKQFVFLLLILGLIAAVFLRVRYGGGERYEDLSTTPIVRANAVQEVLAYPKPIGSVAVSDDGRLFFTVHPDSRPLGNKLLEWVDGAAVPFPDGAAQQQRFDTVLGLHIDTANRLWTLDHGKHGTGSPRLLAIDIVSLEVLLDHRFSDAVAPAGSYLQDLAISADGKTAFIADASIWRKRPALIVYDIDTQSARRVLENHAAISAEDYRIVSDGQDVTFFGGLITLKSGLSGIALDQSGEWLFLAAMSNDSVYRVPVSQLADATLTAEALAKGVQKYSRKPLSAEMTVTTGDRLLITDVEHGAIFKVGANRQLVTLASLPDLRWPEALTVGPGGWIYVADSARSTVILKPRNDIEAKGPYYIYRVPVEAGAELSL